MEEEHLQERKEREIITTNQSINQSTARRTTSIYTKSKFAVFIFF